MYKAMVGITAYTILKDMVSTFSEKVPNNFLTQQPSLGKYIYAESTYMESLLNIFWLTEEYVHIYFYPAQK